MLYYEVFPDPFGEDPPLDIATATRVLTDMFYTLIKGPIVPDRQALSLDISNLLSKWDTTRTEHIRYLRRELLDHMNRVPRPIILSRDVKGL